MKFARTTALVASLLVTLSAGVAIAASPPSWEAARAAVLPPGATGLPQGYLPALSCASAGNCIATGDYTDSTNVTRGLILNEVAGVWKRPTSITAPAGAAASSGITPYGASCGSPGNCAVVGSYQDTAGRTQSFALNEVAGVWKRAVRINLPANAVVVGQSSQLRAVVCSTSTRCSATGVYLDDNKPIPRSQGYAVDEVAGTWRRAVQVRLPSDANANPFASLGELACASGGNCAATGSYIDQQNVTHGLVVDEVAGAWRTGVALALPSDANAYPSASLSSVSCPGIGDCTAIGTYLNAAGALEGLTVSEHARHWDRAITMQMPFGAAANPHVFFYGFSGISCARPGTCATGGQYRDSAGLYQGFLIDEVAGVWASAVELSLPTGAQAAGKNGGVVALSCTTAGSCSAGAAYLDASGAYQALIVDEVNGIWRTGMMVTLPAGAATVGVDGGVYGLVCAKNGRCTATGSYQSSPTNYQGFTVSSR